MSVAVSVLRAANNRIGGKGYGYVMGAKKLKGGGAGVWFNYDGDFEGATVMNAFGAGANAFAYNRTRMDITRISRNANYPGRKVAKLAPPWTSPPKTSPPKRDDGWVEARPMTGPAPKAKTVQLELPSSYVIRSEADARKSCRNVEIRTRGKWRVSIPGKNTLCLMRYELHGPRRLELEAGPICNNAHAKQVYPALGHRLGSIWDNYWHTTVPGLMSMCTIEFTEATLSAAARRKPPPRKAPPQKAPPKRGDGWVVGRSVTGSGPKANIVDLELPSSFVIRTEADAEKSYRHVEINTRGKMARQVAGLDARQEYAVPHALRVAWLPFPPPGGGRHPKRCRGEEDLPGPGPTHGRRLGEQMAHDDPGSHGALQYPVYRGVREPRRRRKDPDPVTLIKAPPRAWRCRWRCRRREAPARPPCPGGSPACGCGRRRSRARSPAAAG